MILDNNPPHGLLQQINLEKKIKNLTLEKDYLSDDVSKIKINFKYYQILIIRIKYITGKKYDFIFYNTFVLNHFYT